jgi:hypothetical protein
MSESPLNELDDVLRSAVERSRQVPVSESDLAGAIERIAARAPRAQRRGPWPELLRRAVAAAAVLLLGALLINQASAAWAEVAGAPKLSVHAAGDGWPDAVIEGPPVRKKWTPLLVVHVFSVVAGYAVYALAWLLSCAALVAMFFADASRLLWATVRISAVLLALGVLSMLLGVVLGAVWAKENLGRYWGWDIRETNGLATLFLGVVWLALTWRQVHRTTKRIEPGLVAAACFWAAIAGWWGIAFVGNGVFLWQTGLFICTCVLLNVALVAGAWRLHS